jgi:hypothetical protein
MTFTTEEQHERRKDQWRRYYHKNREKILSKRSEEDERERRRAAGKLYWEKNKEEILAKRNAKPRTDEVREKARLYAQGYRAKNPEKHREAGRRHTAKNPGRSWDLLQRQQEAKAGRPRATHCEICNVKDSGRGATTGTKGNRIAFDHCHKTGAFRGWICSNCNKALGLVKDNTDLLRKMIEYLEQFQ